MLKTLGLACVAFGMLCAAALLPITFWLLSETARDPKTRGVRLRIRAVPAAALRGEWPNLRSARWYRRMVRGLLIGWAGGACTIVLQEISR